MNRILVPLDGSDFAERALSPAVALATRHGAEIHLLSVVSNVPIVPVSFADPILVPDWLDQEEARLRGYVERAAAKIAARSGELRVEARVRVGRVGETITGVADELDIDLVVLTTHGRGPVRRAWLGSTADELLRSLERPLLLLSPTAAGERLFADGQIHHVMVPLDGSEAAEAALDAVSLVFPATGDVRLTLASVVEEGFPLPTAYLPHVVSEESFREERIKTAAAYLATVSQRLGNEGTGLLETHVLTAHDAAHGLLGYSSEAEADVIALVTHGRGGVARFLVGSVADKLVRGAEIPVLIARRPPDGARDSLTG